MLGAITSGLSVGSPLHNDCLFVEAIAQGFLLWGWIYMRILYVGNSSQNESLSGEPITERCFSLWRYRHKDFDIRSKRSKLIF